MAHRKLLSRSRQLSRSDVDKPHHHTDEPYVKAICSSVLLYNVYYYNASNCGIQKQTTPQSARSLRELTTVQLHTRTRLPFMPDRPVTHADYHATHEPPWLTGQSPPSSTATLDTICVCPSCLSSCARSRPAPPPRTHAYLAHLPPSCCSPPQSCLHFPGAYTQ